MKVPSFGLIHDGAPNAFTYGHTPNNMRVVITQGILDLLEPAEVEGVVAHELGHGKNWDMLLMTVVQLVPLVMYFLYRTAMQFGGRGKDGGYRVAVAVGAYVLYIASEYIVLWFSRCREYYADRFAGRVTGNPNALASALVKIGYGLAARGGPAAEEAAADTKDKKAKKKVTIPALDGIGALGIFDRRSAVAMVASSAAGVGTGVAGTGSIRKENLKSAMQWDLWNPWATFYELNSTHPLVAHRLQYLSDQSVVMGQEPFVVFDRRKPESYWDDFAVDLLVMLLPVLLLLVGLAAAAAIGVFSLGAVAGKGWLALAGPAADRPGYRLAGQDLVHLPGRLLRAAVRLGAAAQGEGLGRPAGAGPDEGDDHRQGSPGPDLVRGLRDAGRHGHPLPRLSPAAPALGLALRPPPRGAVRRQGRRGRRLVPPLAGAVPRAEVDHRRRRHPELLRPAFQVRLGRVPDRGRHRPGRGGGGLDHGRGEINHGRGEFNHGIRSAAEPQPGVTSD